METLKRVLNWTLVRFVLEVGIFVGAMQIFKILYVSYTGDDTPIRSEGSFASSERAVFGIGAMFASYVIAVGLVERRWIGELSLTKLAREGIVGTGYGFLALSSLVGVLYLIDAYNVTGLNEAFPFIHILVWVCFFAIIEEIQFRGFLYRIVEERFGTWAGLLISAVPFGIVHMGNPSASAVSTIAIVIAGMWLGILYTSSGGRLWIPIFVHIIWNYAQALFGIPVSGTTMFGNYLESEMTGPDWATGGAFGLEASYLAIGLIASLFLISYLSASRRGLIKPLRLSAREIEIIEEVAEEAAEVAVLKS